MIEKLHSLQELRTHGYRFAMDDFGSGYAGLSMPRTLPLII
ncbi:EAL domain-containing protein [Vibrio sp. D420a]|nr:EAL domain-containing protein [Vibrio sp. D420a]